jgi:hypothetical protein
MRTAVGPVLLAGLFVAAGGGVLHAIRPFRRSPLQWIAALGLAYLIGVSVVGLIVIGLITAGVAISLFTFTVVALAVAGIGLGVGLLRQRYAPTEASAQRASLGDRTDRIVLVALVAGFGAFALVLLTQFTSVPWLDWDGWAIWMGKAKALFYFNGLEPAYFAGSNYTYIHQDYPILLPTLEMLHFRAIGTVDRQSVHVQFWLILAAFPGALGYLASRAGRPAVWAPIVFGAVTVPAVYTVIVSGLADVPVAIWITCGALALGLWIESRRREDLAIAIILLAGAASIKNEGLLAAVVILVMAAVVLATERPRRRLLELAAGIAVFAVAIAPWQLWAAMHHVPKDVQPGDGLNPAYLFSHLERFMPATRELLNQITLQDRWNYFVPLAMVAAGVALVLRRASRSAAFYALSGVGFFFALVWAYWAAPWDLATYLAQSAFRVVSGVAGISMAALAHLAPRIAAPSASEAEAEDRPTLAEQSAHAQQAEPAEADRARPPAGLLTFWRPSS